MSVDSSSLSTSEHALVRPLCASLAALGLALCLGACGGPQQQAQSAETQAEVVDLPPAAKAGTVTVEQNGLVLTAKLLSAQPADGQDFTFDYQFTIRNDGDDLQEWSFDIPFTKPVTFLSGENADYVANGNVLTVRGRAYNSLLPNGSEFKGMTFKVRADGNAVIAPHA